jgi:IS1 family transposase
MLAVSKALKIPYTTIRRWIINAGKIADKRIKRRIRRLKRRGKVKNISIDEMLGYVGRKNNKVWIWTIIVEIENGEIERYIYVGDRSEEILDEILMEMPEAEEYETDGYDVYRKLIKGRHIVRKGGRVNRNEGFHSVIRSYIASLRRKTKAFMRNIYYLKLVLSLFLLHYQQFG